MKAALDCQSSRTLLRWVKVTQETPAFAADRACFIYTAIYFPSFAPVHPSTLPFTSFFRKLLGEAEKNAPLTADSAREMYC